MTILQKQPGQAGFIDTDAMSPPYPIPSTPKIISPSPTPSEASEKHQDGYFAPVTRSAAKKQSQESPRPDPISEEKEGSGSDSSLDKRARTRSRSPLVVGELTNGSTTKRRRMSGLTPVVEPKPLTNGKSIAEVSLPPTNGHLSPYARVQKSWREFSRSPSPLGLIPLHRHYRNFIHKHEIPRKLLHVSIGFFTLGLYTRGVQATAITPWLMGAFIPIASTDLLRHRWPAFNRFYVRCLGALMRETEVDGYNGVIWYLLGAYIALRFYPKDIGTVSILLLSWCDTAASTFGRLYGRYTIRLRRGKSLAGSLAAFATGALIAAYFWGWVSPRIPTWSNDPIDAYMYQDRLTLPSQVKQLLGWSEDQGTVTGTAALAVMSVCTGLIASVSEFIDIFSWDDNLTIPLLSSAGIWAFLKVFS